MIAAHSKTQGQPQADGPQAARAANAVNDQAAKAASALSSAPPAEAARVLPVVLQDTRSGNELRVRQYATLFLLTISLRPDGARLLSSNSREVASLLVDPELPIQKGAIAITDYLIAKPETDRRPYLSALLAGVQNPQTPQEVAVDMAAPLLVYDAADPAVATSVHNFLDRTDLATTTRFAILNNLAPLNLPEAIGQQLIKLLDDPDLRVRAAAVVAYGNSTFTYHRLAKEPLVRIANDPRDNKQLRDLAQEALAGHKPLNPNIDVAR